MIADLKPYPAMKDSGVEWLGKVPEHWEVRQLGRMGKFSKGNGGTKEDETESGVPCVRYGDLYTQHRFFIEKTRSFVSQKTSASYTPIQYGDVLFAGSGETIEEIGKSAVTLLPESACCGGDVIIFRPSIPVNASFVGLATDCPQAAYQKSCMGRGITVMHIYGDELKYMSVALPPLPEQIAIVRYLDHVDRRVRRLVRAKRKLVALLTEQKQAIIHHAVTRGLDPDVPLKDSGVEWLGQVPEHWRIARLGRLTTRIGDGLHGAPQYVDKSDYRFVNGNNLSNGRIVVSDTTRCVSADEYEKHRIDLDDSTILMSINGTIGNLAYYSGEAVVLGKSAAYFKCGDELSRRFLFYMLQSRRALDLLCGEATGTTILNLSLDTLRRLPVSLPPHSEQEQIASFLQRSTAAVDEAAEKAEQELDFLHEYRTRLIADVVTGKRDVREAAAALPEVDPLNGEEDLDETPDVGADGIVDVMDAMPEKAQA